MRLGLLGLAVLGLAVPLQLASQAAPPALQFEVASVKPNRSNSPPASNFPLGPGDVYVRNGGLFSATGFPLIIYISFAYKMAGNEEQYLLRQLPDWAKIERFDIQARASGDPGKDQMRQMMGALLADRFQLKIRFERREVPVLAFTLAKAGKTGPQIRQHANQSNCPTEQPSLATPAIVNGTPVFCNGIYKLTPSASGRLRFGGRNVTIGFIADTFSARTNLGRPMTDQTGLTGTFDFTLEWAPDRSELDQPADGAPDPAGPSFEQALRQQLGIRLTRRWSPVNVPVVDHVERPSTN